ncbi:response regulator transcription factor [Variovorax defluvii]|uniref:Response regulator transcription factor n=1 Tax=Variovorax defluvii TaxID=913761 RepID=A0ABP8I009_9BURK
MKNNELAVLLVAVGTLGTPMGGLADVVQADPDTGQALLDAEVPGSAGLSGVEALLSQCRAGRLVILSGTCDTKTIQAALQKSAPALMEDPSGQQILLSALRSILNEGLCAPEARLISGSASQESDISARSTSAFSAKAAARGLTNRQIDVLRELLQGNSNKQICRNLKLAMGTVKAHVTAVLAALEVSSRAEAIAAAHRLGLDQLVEERACAALPGACPESASQ